MIDMGPCYTRDKKVEIRVYTADKKVDIGSVYTRNKKVVS